MIVERISGVQLDRFARERLFAPLGMADSDWGPTTCGNVVAFPHALPGRPLTPPGRIVDQIAGSCAFPIGNAGLFTTARDQLLFAEDMLARRRFPKAYYDLLSTRAFSQGTDMRSFGWDMRPAGRPRNSSDATIFHTGSTGQTIAIDPERGLAAVLLTVRRGGHNEAIVARRRVMDILFENQKKG